MSRPAYGFHVGHRAGIRRAFLDPWPDRAPQLSQITREHEVPSSGEYKQISLLKSTLSYKGRPMCESSTEIGPIQHNPTCTRHELAKGQTELLGEIGRRYVQTHFAQGQGGSEEERDGRRGGSEGDGGWS